MRQRESGWVHARLVDGKMVVLLAQQFKKEGGKILLALRLKKAVACGGDEAAGCGYVVEYGDEAEGVVDDAELLEEDKVGDGDERGGGPGAQQRQHAAVHRREGGARGGGEAAACGGRGGGPGAQRRQHAAAHRMSEGA